MGESAPAITAPGNEVDALAAAVRDSGQSEDSLALLAKGSVNAFDKMAEMGQGLLDLIKGKGKADEEDEDEDEDEDDDDDDGPGFRQMGKGADMPESSDGPMDATSFLIDLQKSVTDLLDGQIALHDALAARDAQIETLLKSQEHLGKMVEHLGGIVGESTQTLAKGVVGLTEKLGQIPAASRTPVFVPRVADDAPPESTTGFLGGVGSKREEKALLMKALNKVTTPFQDNLFRTTGVFSSDPSEHNAIAARVGQLATKVQA